MATTGVNFLYIATATVLEGASVLAGPTVIPISAGITPNVVAGSGGVQLDKAAADCSIDGFAKHGAAVYATSGTTPVTVDLTNLATGAASSCGDATLAHWNKLILTNLGAADMTFAQGGSNPATLGFAGTTPTLKVPAGSRVILESVAAVVVDSTHKNITITPTSGGNFAVVAAGD